MILACVQVTQSEAILERILLIQLRQLGDILLTTPCIREVRKHYPTARIDFLSHKMGKLILKDNPYIDALITYDEKEGLAKQLQLMNQLRKSKYDLVVDFMYNPRSALLAFATRAPRRVAFPSRRNWAFTQIVPQPKTSDYIVREKFHLLRALGIPCDDEALTLPWQEKDVDPFLQFRTEEGIANDSMRVVLSPTHRREPRQWPVERYAELADYLVETYQATVVWAWGPGEKEFVERARSLCKAKTYMAPPTTFAELAAFFANCDLFVGNSNGPSHVAVSAQIPSLQLHGPTIAVTWCPNSEIHRSVQKQQMEQISVREITLNLDSMIPIIKNNVTLRLKNGDRMKWNQAGLD